MGYDAGSMGKGSKTGLRVSGWSASMALLMGSPGIIGAAQAAPQQENPDSALALQDIVVTAQKRAESLRDVPIALSVVDGETLSARGITRFDELSRIVPSLSFEPGATPNENSFSLRGISAAAVGQGQQSSVGVYIDGIYLTGRSALNLDLFDVERIEVLRGPQGTLFGRNTVAGALSIISRRPTDALQGTLEAEYGSYDLQRLRGSVGGRVGEGPLYAQTAVSYVSRDGYVRNRADGTRLQGGSSIANRTYLGFRPDDGRFTLELVADYTHEDNQSGILTDRPFDRAVSINAPNTDSRTVYGLSATATYDLGGASLTAVSGYRGWTDQRLADADSSPRDEQTTDNRGNVDSFSQEIRLASQGTGPLEWLVGGYIYREVNRLTSEIALTFPTPFGLQKFTGTSQTRLVDRSLAGFGQASYTFAPGWKITAGGRISRDRQSIAAQRGGFIPNLITPGSNRFATSDTDVSLKAALQYAPSEAATFYATVAEGYKSAGINASALPPMLAAQQVFRPERSINYEAGFKGLLFDRRLSFDTAFFYITYDDLQVFRSDPLTFTNYVTNADSARSYGAEVEMRARLTDRLEFSGSAAINRTRYQRFTQCTVGVDCSGNRLTNAPSMTANGRVSYRLPLGDSLELLLATDLSYTGRTFFEPTNVAASRRNGFAIWNADLALSEISQGWTLSAYGKNLTKQDYITDALEVPLPTGGSSWRYLAGTPRTFGVRLRYDF